MKKHDATSFTLSFTRAARRNLPLAATPSIHSPVYARAALCVVSLSPSRGGDGYRRARRSCASCGSPSSRRTRRSRRRRTRSSCAPRRRARGSPSRTSSRWSAGRSTRSTRSRERTSCRRRARRTRPRSSRYVGRDDLTHGSYPATIQCRGSHALPRSSGPSVATALPEESRRSHSRFLSSDYPVSWFTRSPKELGAVGRDGAPRGVATISLTVPIQ